MKMQLNPKIYEQRLPAEIDFPEVPMGAVLKGAAQSYPQHDAFVYKGRSLKYAVMYAHALRFANSLKKLGIAKGDVVAVHMPNCLQFPVVYYGILLAGAVYTPVNPLLPKDELIFQVKDADAKAIVSFGQIIHYSLDLPTLSKVKHIIGTDETESEALENSLDVSVFNGEVLSFNQLVRDGEEQELAIDFDVKNDLAHIAYTGGTTGRSKGVMITHSNLVSNILQAAVWSLAAVPYVEDGALKLKLVEQDEEKYLQEYPALLGTNVRLSPAPFSHGAGAMGGLGYSVLTGAKSIILDRFIPDEFLRIIEEERVTEVTGAPAMFNFLLAHPDMHTRDFSNVRAISSGTAPIAAKTMELLEEKFPNATVVEGYGLTEVTASAVQSVCFASGERRLGTVGLPIYKTEVKLMSIDGPMREQIEMPGERGEICIKGPQVMKGYINNIEATEETLIDGWLYTGDIGVFDEEGFLSIVDRKKDMLIYNGYNVYPRQIEEILYTHPAVQVAVVIGKEDPNVGEKPKAFVVLKQGQTVTEEEIMDFVNTKVVHYSKLREVEFLAELPMTAVGKISKIKLIELENSRSK